MPPANDDLANAQLISGTSGQVGGNNTDATAEVGEYAPLGHTDGRTVWFKKAIDAAGSFFFDTLLTNIATWSTAADNYADTMLAVLVAPTATPAHGDLTFLAFNDDTDAFNRSYTVVDLGEELVGQFLFIQVSGYSPDDFGPFVLRWGVYVPPVPPEPPANDDFANAEVISGTAGSISCDNALASEEIGELDVPPGYQTNRSVWYELTPAVDGFLEVHASYLVGFAYLVISVWQGGSSGASPGAQVGAAYNDLTAVPLAAGVTYHICIADYTPTTTDGGVFSATWAITGPPTNDRFDDAQNLSGCFGSVVGTLKNAGMGDSHDLHNLTVWYRWVAPMTGRVRFSMLDKNNVATGDPQMAFYHLPAGTEAFNLIPEGGLAAWHSVGAGATLSQPDPETLRVIVNLGDTGIVVESPVYDCTGRSALFLLATSVPGGTPGYESYPYVTTTFVFRDAVGSIIASIEMPYYQFGRQYVEVPVGAVSVQLELDFFYSYAYNLDLVLSNVVLGMSLESQIVLEQYNDDYDYVVPTAQLDPEFPDFTSAPEVRGDVRQGEVYYLQIACDFVDISPTFKLTWRMNEGGRVPLDPTFVAGDGRTYVVVTTELGDGREGGLMMAWSGGEVRDVAEWARMLRASDFHYGGVVDDDGRIYFAADGDYAFSGPYSQYAIWRSESFRMIEVDDGEFIIAGDQPGRREVKPFLAEGGYIPWRFRETQTPAVYENILDADDATQETSLGTWETRDFPYTPLSRVTTPTPHAGSGAIMCPGNPNTGWRRDFPLIPVRPGDTIEISQWIWAEPGFHPYPVGAYITVRYSDGDTDHGSDHPPFTECVPGQWSEVKRTFVVPDNIWAIQEVEFDVRYYPPPYGLTAPSLTSMGGSDVVYGSDAKIKRTTLETDGTIWIISPEVVNSPSYLLKEYAKDGTLLGQYNATDYNLADARAFDFIPTGDETPSTRIAIMRATGSIGVYDLTNGSWTPDLFHQPGIATSTAVGDMKVLGDGTVLILLYGRRGRISNRDTTAGFSSSGYFFDLWSTHVQRWRIGGITPGVAVGTQELITEFQLRPDGYPRAYYTNEFMFVEPGDEYVWILDTMEATKWYFDASDVAAGTFPPGRPRWEVDTEVGIGFALGEPTPQPRKRWHDTVRTVQGYRFKIDTPNPYVGTGVYDEETPTYGTWGQLAHVVTDDFSPNDGQFVFPLSNGGWVPSIWGDARCTLARVTSPAPPEGSGELEITFTGATIVPGAGSFPQYSMHLYDANRFAVEGKQNYYFRASFRREQRVPAMPPTAVGLELWFYTAEGRLIANSTTFAANVFNRQVALPDTSWLTFGVDATAPEVAAFAEVHVKFTPRSFGSEYSTGMKVYMAGCHFGQDYFPSAAPNGIGGDQPMFEIPSQPLDYGGEGYDIFFVPADLLVDDYDECGCPPRGAMQIGEQRARAVVSTTAGIVRAVRPEEPVRIEGRGRCRDCGPARVPESRMRRVFKRRR